MKPGLSSFADEPLKGGETIEQLINIAKGRIVKGGETIEHLKSTLLKVGLLREGRRLTT